MTQISLKILDKPRIHRQEWLITQFSLRLPPGIICVRAAGAKQV